MIQVAIFWDRKTSAHKIPLTKLCRARLGIGLKEAHDNTCRVVAGETLVFEFSDATAAETFAHEVRALGFCADLIGASPDRLI